MVDTRRLSDAEFARHMAGLRHPDSQAIEPQEAPVDARAHNYVDACNWFWAGIQRLLNPPTRTGGEDVYFYGERAHARVSEQFAERMLMAQTPSTLIEGCTLDGDSRYVTIVAGDSACYLPEGYILSFMDSFAGAGSLTLSQLCNWIRDLPREEPPPGNRAGNETTLTRGVSVPVLAVPERCRTQAALVHLTDDAEDCEFTRADSWWNARMHRGMHAMGDHRPQPTHPELVLARAPALGPGSVTSIPAVSFSLPVPMLLEPHESAPDPRFATGTVWL